MGEPYVIRNTLLENLHLFSFDFETLYRHNHASEKIKFDVRFLIVLFCSLPGRTTYMWKKIMAGAVIPLEFFFLKGLLGWIWKFETARAQ